MFTSSWCGGMGVGGWLVMLLFWGAFLGLAVWAVTRMFTPAGSSQTSDDPMEELERRLAAGELDLDTYRRIRDELAVAALVDQGTRRR